MVSDLSIRWWRKTRKNHYHLVAKDTMDEDVMKALEGKEVGQEALLNAVKARVRKMGGNENEC